jgi:hypothetical protein
MRYGVYALAVLLLPLAQSLRAQTGTGSIQGTTRDSTGAAIPGATVKVLHTQTAREFRR